MSSFEKSRVLRGSAGFWGIPLLLWPWMNRMGFPLMWPWLASLHLAIGAVRPQPHSHRPSGINGLQLREYRALNVVRDPPQTEGSLTGDRLSERTDIG